MIHFDTMRPIDPAIIDVGVDASQFKDGHCGYTPELKAADTPEALRDACGDAARDFPSELWIDAKDRPTWAQRNDELRTWAMNFISSYTNQSPSHECTCHDLTRNFVAAHNKQRGIIYRDGPKANFRYAESAKGDVFLSPLSVYAEANPGQWGGAGCIQVLNIACRRGILPDKIQPRDYGFKHTLQGTSGRGNNNQSGGGWVRLSQFPEGWEETAGLFKPLEVIVTRNWEEALCLLLHGRKISYGRSGHAVGPAMWNAASNAFPYPDSYDVTRVDSFGTFKSAVSGGAYCILSTTTPDDWNEPAKVAA
jgi:hypothetical protein